MAESEQATKVVLSVLSNKGVGAIEFELDGWKITPGLYAKVAAAITEKKITVIVDKVSFKETALYVPEVKLADTTTIFDIIALKHTTLSSDRAEKFVQMLAIVHECTHAGVDLLKLEKMPKLNNEALAYIAQSIFAMQVYSADVGDPKNLTWKAKTIEETAWAIAQEISKRDKTAKGPAITKAMSTELYLRINTAYGEEKEKKDSNNDGVGKAWIIKGKTMPAGSLQALVK